MHASESEDLRVNWREELSRVQPFLADRGGVVCISGCRRSAINSFVKLLRSEVKATGAGFSLRLGLDDSTTRYPHDIIVKLETQFGMTVANPPSVTVLKDIRARGNVDIQGVDVDVHFPHGGYVSPQRTDAVAAEVGKRTQQQKCMFVLDNWDERHRDGFEFFWNDLWLNRLAKFIPLGLLLLCVFQTEDGALPAHETIGRSDCTVQLPPRYAGQGLDHACADLTALLVKWTSDTPESCALVARSLLTEWNNEPGRLHERLHLQRLLHSGRLQ